MPNESTARLEPIIELLRRHDVEFLMIGGLEDLVRVKKHIRPGEGSGIAPANAGDLQGTRRYGIKMTLAFR